MRLIRLLFVLAFASPLPGMAQSSRFDEILQRGVLRVGTTGDYRPFTALDKATGGYSGFDIDLARSLADALGVKLEFEATSWPHLASDFEAGAFDIAMGGVSVTLDRAKKGFFSMPYMREGKTPIARCADKDKFGSLAEIDQPGVKVIANPGGTNERFDRAHLHAAEIVVYPDNLTIFDQIAKGDADLMITDASETRFQQKQHPGVLCAIHPDKPLDFAEKAYWMPFDPPLKAFVDQWLHLSIENGAYAAIYREVVRVAAREGRAQPADNAASTVIASSAPAFGRPLWMKTGDIRCPHRHSRACPGLSRPSTSYNGAAVSYRRPVG